MNAILGKIVSVTPAPRRRAPRGLAPYTVRFKAVTLMPERAEVPAWLVDQVLTVERQVADARELGGSGDAIALTPAESEKWLRPLVVEPAAIEGKWPRTLALTLRWWKEDKPPEFTVSGLGRKFTAALSRRGERFIASVPLDGLPDQSGEIEIACGDLRGICPVLPADAAPALCRFLDNRGEGYRLSNPWYAIDIVSNIGGGIVGFRERGRNVDHLAATSETQKPLDKVGYGDRLFVDNWDNKLSDARLAFTIRQRDTDCVRVEIDGVVDEGKNLRSAAAYRLLERLPVLLVRRDVRLGEPKPDEKKSAKVKQDFLVPLQLGIRCATAAEGDGRLGSHVIALDGDRVAMIRGCHENEYAYRGDWGLRSGWTLVCHPLRRQVMLFVFDGQRPPKLQSFAGSGFLTFEAYWPVQAYYPPAGTANAIALSAGELCGAAAGGGWVACRTRLRDGTIRCAAVAKLAAGDRAAIAEFRLGRETRHAPLEPKFVEGVGQMHVAGAEFGRGHMSEAFDAVVAGITSRGKP